MITDTMVISILLRRGSGVQNCKERIRNQFLKGESSEENITFLKKEYGIGGCCPALPYVSHLNEDHDAKGIRLRIGFLPEEEGYEERLVKWDEVERIYAALIKSGVYNITYDSRKLYRIINTITQ